MSKTAVAIRHVHFEDLGTFAPVLEQAGYHLTYRDLPADGDAAGGTADLDSVDLLVVLGGPVGVHDGARYPFLEHEQALLARRVAAERPTLGICLGAQLVAASLGADVAPMGRKEIGFAPLTLTAAGQSGPLRHLDGCPVLHWHGDAFLTPRDATRLATTSACPHQAFALGPSVLALQFHPEADAAAGLERWLVGHAVELAAAGIDPQTIRADAVRFGAPLARAAQAMLGEWLAGLPQ